MSVEEIANRGSTASQDAFFYLREQLKSESGIVESVEYEPLKDTDAPTYSVRDTPRVRVFFGDKLEIFVFIPEKAVSAIKADPTVPDSLKAWVDRAQPGGMSRLLRVQLGSRSDAEVLMPLIKSVVKQ